MPIRTGNRRFRGALPAMAMLSAMALAGCQGGIPPHEDPATPPPGSAGKNYPTNNTGSVFGGNGVDLLGALGGGSKSDEGGSGIGVNSYLWRATLDTMSFVPLASADPFGGVIITDWYSPPSTPDERLKLNVFILARQLRADGLRVSVFRQNRVKGADGAVVWQDATVDPETGTKLEDRILTRARQLRFAESGDG